jgi:hypothetical protein
MCVIVRLVFDLVEIIQISDGRKEENLVICCECQITCAYEYFLSNEAHWSFMNV